MPPRFGETGIALIVAVSRWDERSLRSLTGFAEQVSGRGELIVVDGTGQAGEIAGLLPGCLHVAGAAGALTPKLWAQGLAHARGERAAFTTDRMLPCGDWLTRLSDRLDSGGGAFSGVGGAIEADQSELSAWDLAVYLHRFSAYASTASGFSTRDPAGDNALYSRSALAQARAEFEPAFWEAEIHRRMKHEGSRLAVEPNAKLRYQGGEAIFPFLTRRFVHAYVYGSWRMTGRSAGHRLARACAAPVCALVLTWRGLRNAASPAIPPLRVPAVCGFLAVIAAVWALGEAAGMIAPVQRRKTPARRPLPSASA